MSEVTRRTNGDYIEPAVAAVKRGMQEMAKWAREHPDEAAVAAAPCLLLTLATFRHDLSVAEAFVVTETGYYAGLLALKYYREWKSRPAGPAPRLRKVG